MVDTTVAQKTKDLSTEEVNDCLNELESLGLVKILKRISDTLEKKDSETFRLINITKKGLAQLESK